MYTNKKIGLKYFKKISAVLLLGFILIINTIPVSFSQECGITKNLGIESDAAFKARCEAITGCQITGTMCIAKITTPEVNSGLQDTTIKSTDLEQCLTVGYSVTKDKDCKENEVKIKCATDPSGWRCVSNKNENTLQQTDLSKIGSNITTYKAKVEIPCNTKIIGGTCPKDWQTSISSYITRLYQFGLMASGLVALGAIMYGAVLYTLSAGNVGSKDEGKEWIKNAIYGVVLLFGAYLILYTINPNLVKLTNPEISPVNLSDYEPEQIYIPEGGVGIGNNPVNQGGGSAIPGCEISSSGALGTLDDFASLDVNGKQVASTGKAGTFECQKCLAGNELKKGKCECSSGLVRRYTGVCCKNDQVLVKGVCTGCNYLKQFHKEDNYTKELSASDKAEINKLCGTDF